MIRLQDLPAHARAKIESTLGGAARAPVRRKPAKPPEIVSKPSPSGPVEFWTEGRPTPKERPRTDSRNGGVRTFTPTKTVAYERKVAFQARLAMDGRAPFAGPVAVEMIFVVPVPKSWSEKKKSSARAGTLLPTVRPDLDNVGKALLDSCNRILWGDDSQVAKKTIVRLYGDEAGVFLNAFPAPDVDAAAVMERIQSAKDHAKGPERTAL